MADTRKAIKADFQKSARNLFTFNFKNGLYVDIHFNSVERQKENLLDKIEDLFHEFYMSADIFVGYEKGNKIINLTDKFTNNPFLLTSEELVGILYKVSVFSSIEGII